MLYQGYSKDIEFKFSGGYILGEYVKYNILIGYINEEWKSDVGYVWWPWIKCDLMIKVIFLSIILQIPISIAWLIHRSYNKLWGGHVWTLMWRAWI